MPRRPWVLILVALFAVAAVARAEPRDAMALVDRWLEAQNRGDFESYQKLYATQFEGIRRSGARVQRLDRAGWIKDRERMFRSKMTVTAEDRKVEPYGSGHRVTLKQTWASGKYKDVGTKELILLDEGGELRIFREEMLESIKDLGIKSQALLVWDAGRPEDTAGALDAAERLATLLSTVMVFPSGFPTRLEGGVNGVSSDEAVVALGVCTAAEAAAVYDLFRRLGPRASLRETTWKPRARETSCPAFEKGWTWPGAAASAVTAAGTLTVVALRRDDGEREAKEHLFLAVVGGKDGAVQRLAAFKGGSDLSELSSIERSGGGVVVREKFVEEKGCKSVVQTLRFEVKEGEVEKRVAGREVSETGSCAQETTQSR